VFPTVSRVNQTKIDTMQMELQEHTPAFEVGLAHSTLLIRGERLRIMHVVNYLRRGGTEFGILKLIDGLGSEQFEQRLCSTRQVDPEFVEAYRLKEILSLAAGSRRGLQFPLFRLRKIFQQYRPHIVHTRNWGGLEAVLAARLAGVPVVIHSEHGYEVGNLAGVPFRQRAFRRMAYSMADHVFTVTRDLREYHARQGWTKPGQIGVIYNGVDIKRYSPSAQYREFMRRELGFPKHRLVLGSVGRLVPIKDFGTMFKVAENLSRRNIDVHVLLVGKGPELERLQRQVNESLLLRDRVTFVGASDHVPELLNAMDIFVLPSLGEGMSNTLLEAMATGLPLVATRVGGNPEVVGEGQPDCLFAPEDVRGLSERVERLAADPAMRLRLAAAGRQRAIDLFSLEGMIRSYRELYLSAALKRGILPSREESTTGVSKQRIA
jgi:sugar transferase (PEP-CTERM/EpsH1 system associated)